MVSMTLWLFYSCKGVRCLASVELGLFNFKLLAFTKYLLVMRNIRILALYCTVNAVVKARDSSTPVLAVSGFSPTRSVVFLLVFNKVKIIDMVVYHFRDT